MDTHAPPPFPPTLLRSILPQKILVKLFYNMFVLHLTFSYLSLKSTKTRKENVLKYIKFSNCDFSLTHFKSF